MFGYTFANLDNEVQFLRRSLSWVNGGDYLILDLPAASTDSADPAEIRKRDPGLAHRRGAEWRNSAFQFLMGPIRRYMDGVLDWKVTTELDQSSCLIPGSYALDAIATVRTRNAISSTSWRGTWRAKAGTSCKACTTAPRTSSWSPSSSVTLPSPR